MFRDNRALVFGLPVIAAAGLLFAIVSIANSSVSRPRVEARFEPAPPRQPNVSDHRRGGTDLIGAMGIVEPSSQDIKVGTEVSGIVTDVFVSPGNKVRRGEPLFALNSARAEALLAQRRGDVAVARARLELARSRAVAMKADVQVAHAAVEAAESERDEASDLVRMAGGLNTGSTITPREVARRSNALRQSEAKLAEAHGRLAAKVANHALFDESGDPGASIAVDLAAIEQAQRSLHLAVTDLDLRTVRASDEGMVLQVNIRPGEYALAGMLSQGLIVLGKTEPIHLRIDIDEADIGRYRPGATAIALDRGRSRRQFDLRFVRAEPLVVPKRALSGQITERIDTRVMQVIYAIELDGPGALIGQQFDVFIEADPIEVRQVDVAAGMLQAKKASSLRSSR